LGDFTLDKRLLAEDVTDVTFPLYIHWCSYSVQNLLSSRLFSKNLKIKTYKTVILPFVPYGCETRVTKSRRMRWAGHVARMGEGRCV
jgi:hypothetical protein